jgi:predicted ferric reductase
MGSYPVLRFWIILLCVAGLISYVYMLVFYKVLGPRYMVKVSRVDHLANITEVHVEKPHGFNYQPGQYIFIRFPRFEGIKELFPFSISNDPCQKDIRISIRRSGDYTSDKIPLVEKGDRVIIMGPYGKFGARYLEHRKDMIWLAGGIGITPFLSLAKHESMFPTGRKIQLIWVFRDPKDPTHDSELFTETRRNPKFNYVHWISSQKGKLGVDDVVEIIGEEDELKRRVIMMCGPPNMVSSLAKELHKKGIPYRNMLFEDFNMLD